MTNHIPPEWPGWVELKKKEIWQILEYERRATGLFFPGTYDPSLCLMQIHPALVEDEAALVYFHELAHFIMGQTNYGEAIRRLDNLEVLISSPLELRRCQLIVDFVRRTLGHEPSIAELTSQIAMPTAALHSGIREQLAADTRFVDALRTIHDCEKRKEILSSQWLSVQEGFAWWACLTLGRKYFEASRNDRGLEKVTMLSSHLERALSNHVQELEGYHTVSSIAEALDSDFTAVYSVVHACLNPSFSRLPLMNLSLNKLCRRVAESRFSPDKRLLSASRLVAREQRAQRPTVEELTCMLDSRGAMSAMTIDSFNKYWFDSVDVHPMVLSLINGLLRDAGSKKRYKPRPIDMGKGSARITDLYPVIQASGILPEYGGTSGLHYSPSTTLTGQGRSTRGNDVLEQYQAVALTRDRLLKMAKEEGLLA